MFQLLFHILIFATYINTNSYYENPEFSSLIASIAQLVERPLLEREVVGSNPAAAPYQRCKGWY